VTLGTVHGVLPGSYLAVYEKDNKVGQMVVDISLDVISYARPTNENLDLKNINYLRVVKE